MWWQLGLFLKFSHLLSSCHCESRSVMPNSLQPHGLYTVHGTLQARILEWVSLSLPQGIFPTQGWNPGLPNFRRILYKLSRKGSPRILEWVACPFSRGSSQPRNWTGISSIAGRFFNNRDIRKAHQLLLLPPVTVLLLFYTLYPFWFVVFTVL